jgi:hypothetical protein
VSSITAAPARINIVVLFLFVLLASLDDLVELVVPAAAKDDRSC